MKPETEKQDPDYQNRRAKNNDAVRKSRAKTKRDELEIKMRLEFLEKDNIRKQHRIDELETYIKNANQQCECGAFDLHAACSYSKRH